MKKKTYIIAISCACAIAILISAFYFAPAYSKRPFWFLTASKVESIYLGENENNKKDEDEIKAYVEKLRKLRLVKTNEMPYYSGGYGFMWAIDTIKLKSGRKITFTEGEYAGKILVKIDEILYEAKYVE